MSNESSHTLMAFVVGAIAGGAAALLFAPTSGSELREKIGEGADKARVKAKETAQQARDAATEQYQEVTQKARKAAGDARTSAETHGKAVKEAFKEGKEVYERELAKSH